MIQQLFKFIGWFLWDAKVNTGTAGAKKVVASWVIALAFLIVSVPHSTEAIYQAEIKNKSALILVSHDVTSIALAVGIEVIATLLLLVALHTNALANWQRWSLLAMAAPFVGLTLHLQASYYFPSANKVEVWPIELALALPFGVTCCAVLVAFITAIEDRESKEHGPATSLIQQVADRITEAYHNYLIDSVRKEAHDYYNVIIEEGNRRMNDLHVQLQEAKAAADLVLLNAPERVASAPVTRAEFPETRIKEILSALYAQGEKRIKTPDALKLIGEVWNGNEGQ